MVVGKNAKTYLDASGAGQDAWTEITAVGDVDMPDSYNDEAINTRESEWQKHVLGQRVLELSFNFKIKNGNAVFEALRDAFNNGTVIGLANYIGDITTSGAQGLQMDAVITEMPKSIPLEGQANTNMKFKPAYGSTFEPVWAVTA